MEYVIDLLCLLLLCTVLLLLVNIIVIKKRHRQKLQQMKNSLTQLNEHQDTLNTKVHLSQSFLGFQRQRLQNLATEIFLLQKEFIAKIPNKTD